MKFRFMFLAITCCALTLVDRSNSFSPGVGQADPDIVAFRSLVEEFQNRSLSSVISEIQNEAQSKHESFGVTPGTFHPAKNVERELTEVAATSKEENGGFVATGFIPETLDGSFKGDAPNVILRHDNCSNMTKAELTAIAQVYPQVIIKCNTEKSTLIPKELYSPENSNKSEDLSLEYQSLMFSRDKMSFYELLVVTERSHSIWKQPISTCVTPRSEGKGLFELQVTLDLLLRLNAGVSRGFKFFVNGLTVAASAMLAGEWSYSISCNYENNAVRPMAEISSVITKERARKWSVDLGSTKFLELGDWVELEQLKVYPNSIILSCVSEKQVPDICSWSDIKIQKEIEKNLFDDFE